MDLRALLKVRAILLAAVFCALLLGKRCLAQDFLVNTHNLSDAGFKEQLVRTSGASKFSAGMFIGGEGVTVNDVPTAFVGRSNLKSSAFEWITSLPSPNSSVLSFVSSLTFDQGGEFVFASVNVGPHWKLVKLSQTSGEILEESVTLVNSAGSEIELVPGADRVLVTGTTHCSVLSVSDALCPRSPDTLKTFFATFSTSTLQLRSAFISARYEGFSPKFLEASSGEAVVLVSKEASGVETALIHITFDDESNIDVDKETVTSVSNDSPVGLVVDLNGFAHVFLETSGNKRRVYEAVFSRDLKLLRTSHICCQDSEVPARMVGVAFGSDANLYSTIEWPEQSVEGRFWNEVHIRTQFGELVSNTPINAGQIGESERFVSSLLSEMDENMGFFGPGQSLESVRKTELTPILVSTSYQDVVDTPVLVNQTYRIENSEELDPIAVREHVIDVIMDVARVVGRSRVEYEETSTQVSEITADVVVYDFSGDPSATVQRLEDAAVQEVFSSGMNINVTLTETPAFDDGSSDVTPTPTPTTGPETGPDENPPEEEPTSLGLSKGTKITIGLAVVGGAIVVFGVVALYLIFFLKRNSEVDEEAGKTREVEPEVAAEATEA